MQATRETRLRSTAIRVFASRNISYRFALSLSVEPSWGQIRSHAGANLDSSLNFPIHPGSNVKLTISDQLAISLRTWCAGAECGHARRPMGWPRPAAWDAWRLACTRTTRGSVWRDVLPNLLPWRTRPRQRCCPRFRPPNGVK
jgi:hypothetical protein